MFDRILKVDYMYGLRFKHLAGVWFDPDVVLDLDYNQSLELLDKIRECLREDTASTAVDIGKYTIDISSFQGKAFSMSIMENVGQMSKPLGDGKLQYDSYMMGKPILEGLLDAKVEIKRVMLNGTMF